jgi:hypothetical protein
METEKKKQILKRKPVYQLFLLLLNGSINAFYYMIYYVFYFREKTEKLREIRLRVNFLFSLQACKKSALKCSCNRAFNI